MLPGHLDKISKLPRSVNCLSIWDIDDTLFESLNTHVYVLHDNKIVKRLTTSEFNTYRLKPGETVDFFEFKDANIFFHTASPLSSNIKKAKDAIESNHTFMVTLTARTNFNDKGLFLKKMSMFGLDLNRPDTHAIRAGNLNMGSPSVAKAKIISECLATNRFKSVYMYDDSSKNLDAFLALKSANKGVHFGAYLAQHGKLKHYG